MKTKDWNRTWYMLVLAGAAMASAVQPARLWAQLPLSGLEIEEEEEEPAGVRPKPSGLPLAVEEEEEEVERPGLAPPKAAAGGLLQDLLQKAEADDEAVEAEPVVDFVSFRAGPTVESRPVRLIENWLGEFPPKDRHYTFYRSSTGTGKATWEVAGDKIIRIQYYEQRMVKKAAEELRLPVEQLARPGQLFDLTVPDFRNRLIRAEAILATAIAEHDSAVQRFERRGGNWSAHVRTPLADALFNLQKSQAYFLLRQRNFRGAEDACDRIIRQAHVDDARRLALRSIYEEIYLRQAADAFRDGDFEKSRLLLNEVTGRYPKAPGEKASTFRQVLIEKARETVLRADLETDERRKLELYEQAARIWPHLDGLDERRHRLENRYTILECAYNVMPRGLSPLTARLPVERHAMRLMFESLVRWTDDPQTGPHYTSELAAGRPRTLAKGRHFFLPDCLWADSQDGQPRRLIAEDVRRTCDILKQVRPPAFPAAWGEAIGPIDTREIFEVSIALDRDYWQPLAFMDFMVLPRHRFPAGPISDGDIKAFDREPVGTGPYRLLERDDERLRFAANPFYRRAGHPKISEIAFNRMELAEALARLERGEVHLIYDLGREQVNQLVGKGKQVRSLATRSVYFLAPNYRRKHEWLHNPNYRRAIAHAVDRKQILDQVFRPNGRDADHRALHGPFPRDCWAYADNVVPFDQSQAKSFLAKAQAEEVGQVFPLDLVYPARDANVEAACEAIRDQLAAAGVEVELRAVEPEQFHDEVTVRHNFDLAYWRHDFPDETYWLWPLFDPSDTGPGGANFMGVVPDQDLRDLFKDIAIHKRFSLIQQRMHQLHRHIAQQAWIIPLWQLDTYVAISDSLENVQLDPIYLFDEVDRWELKQ